MSHFELKKMVYQLSSIINRHFAADITLFYVVATEIFTLHKPTFYHTVHIKINLHVR